MARSETDVPFEAPRHGCAIRATQHRSCSPPTDPGQARRPSGAMAAPWGAITLTEHCHSSSTTLIVRPIPRNNVPDDRIRGPPKPPATTNTARALCHGLSLRLAAATGGRLLQPGADRFDSPACAHRVIAHRRHLDAAMFVASGRATLGIAIVGLDRTHDRFGVRAPASGAIGSPRFRSRGRNRRHDRIRVSRRRRTGYC